MSFLYKIQKIEIISEGPSDIFSQQAPEYSVFSVFPATSRWFGACRKELDAQIDRKVKSGFVSWSLESANTLRYLAVIIVWIWIWSSNASCRRNVVSCDVLWVILRQLSFTQNALPSRDVWLSRKWFGRKQSCSNRGFVDGNWGKPRIASIGIADVLAEIRNEHIPNRADLQFPLHHAPKNYNFNWYSYTRGIYFKLFYSWYLQVFSDFTRGLDCNWIYWTIIDKNTKNYNRFSNLHSLQFTVTRSKSTTPSLGFDW